jgi:hypothetical protein
MGSHYGRCGTSPSELADYSACTTWGVVGPRFYLLNVLRKKLSTAKHCRTYRTDHSRWREKNRPAHVPRIRLVLPLDQTFNVGSAGSSPVDDHDYQVPFAFTEPNSYHAPGLPGATRRPDEI